MGKRGKSVRRGKWIGRSQVRDRVLDLIAELDVRGVRWTICGTCRRWQSRCGNIELVAACRQESYAKGLLAKLIDRWGYQRGGEAGAMGFEDGLRTTVIVVPLDQEGAALLYKTGSRGFYTKLRGRAKELGFKLNPRGLWNRETGELVAAATEHEIFTALGLECFWSEERTADAVLKHRFLDSS